MKNKIMKKLRRDRIGGYTLDEIRYGIVSPKNIVPVVMALKSLLDAGKIRMLQARRLSSGACDWDTETVYRIV